MLFLSLLDCCIIFFPMSWRDKLEGRGAVEETHESLRKVKVRVERSLVTGHNDPDRMDILRVVAEVVHGVDRSSLVEQGKVSDQCKVDFSQADDDKGLGLVGKDLGGKGAAQEEAEAKCYVDQEDWHERENEPELLVGETAENDQRKNDSRDQSVMDGCLKILVGEKGSTR